MSQINATNNTRKDTTKAHLIVNVILVLYMTVFTIFYSSYTPHFGSSDSGISFIMSVLYTTRYVPTMMTAALGGVVPGMLGVVLAFLFRSVVDSGFSYMTFIYLLVVCVMDLVARKKFFNKWYKVLFTVVVMQNLVGIFWGIILLALSSNGLSTVTFYQLFSFFIYEFPGCALGCGIIYVMLNFLPDEARLVFDNGKYYVDPSMLSDDERYIVEGRSKVGRVVTNIIVHEAIILGVAAELASNTLVPTMKEYSYIDNQGTAIESDLSSILSTEYLESKVSIELAEEHERENEDASYVGTLLTNTGVNYRYSVRLAMLICILILPLAVLFNRYAQKRIADPVRRLSKAVSGIYSSGEEDQLVRDVMDVHALQINTGDEIEDLYRAVDQSMYRLTDYIQLVKTRKTIEDQLAIEKSANEAKSRFLSNVSHEIRTPINAVMGFDEMILRESHNESILSYARDIMSSSRTLLSIVNDILDFSKIEAGKMEIIPVEYELGSLLNDIVTMGEVRASEKGLKLIADVNEDIPIVLFGDEIRIRQCILNLITNGIKYTEKGTVTLSVDYSVVEPPSGEDNDGGSIMLKVSVRDTGIGIKSEDMSKLTSAFERVEEQRNRTIEGSGLGLSIVVSLLELMGSELKVESRYGMGSVFSFAICQEVINWEPVGNFVRNVREEREKKERYEEGFHARDARILVVDDTRTNLTVIEGLLKKTQIAIDTVTSGKEALEKVRENKYDIIFMDHRMPEMDGIECFHLMQDMEDNKSYSAPVIALTANAISGSRERYFKEGFSNYMSKPVDGRKLEEMILDYLPEDKISLPGDPDYEFVNEDEAETEKKAMKELLTISGIDVSSAIDRCGSAVNVKNVMKDFYLAIDEKAEKIETYLEEKDFRNYTIYVHGLKSSARAVGALDLSDKAAFLEDCGNDGNIDKIIELTPELLELYRSYDLKFAPLFNEIEDESKPVISEEELENAYASMKEFVEGSFFDSADDIMNMLDDYRIPDKYKDKHKQVRRLLSAVDRDGLLKLL